MLALAYLVAALAAMLIAFYLTNRAILAVRDPKRTGVLAPGRGAENWLALPCISAMIMVVPFVGAGVFGLVPRIIPGSILFVGLVAGAHFGVRHFMSLEDRLAGYHADDLPKETPAQRERW